MNGTVQTRRAPLKVLLVEDDEGDVALLLQALDDADAPFDVHVVGDGVQALEALRSGQRRVDLVLLDLNLPRMGGHDVLAELRADPRLAVLPVFVMSTSRSPDDITASYRKGATAFVSKPAEYEGFVAVVRQLVAFLEHVHLPG